MMTHEEKLAAARMYYRDKRDYCKRHHLCYACMQKIDEGGTQTHCSVCRERRNWLARERRKTWSPERIAKERAAQKRWRFEHPEKVEEANRRNSALRAQRRREARDGNQASDQE